MKLFFKNIYYRFYILFHFGQDETDSAILSTVFITILIFLYLFMFINIIQELFYNTIKFTFNNIEIITIFILVFLTLFFFINYKKKYRKNIIDFFINETEKEKVKYFWWFGLFLLFTFLAFIGLVLLNK